MNNKPKYRFLIKPFDGGFVATTREEPYFCVYGSTEESAIEAGLDAFEAYCSYKKGCVVKISVS